VTRNFGYDEAGRQNGHAYDALGRTTTVPAEDTGNPAGGGITVAYHANDMVRAITQADRTTVYTLDVDGERIRSWTDDATGTPVERRHHYANDTDVPTWTDEGGGAWTAPIAGVDGLAATRTETGLQWIISDLRGNRVATLAPGDAGPTSTGRSDEYGNPVGGAAPGQDRYRWLASHMRAADTPGGLVLMGVRLYNPVTGRFLSVDPEPGGNSGPYAYPTDPINNVDTSGEYAIPFALLAIVGAAAIAALIWYYSTCGWNGCTVKVGSIKVSAPYKWAWSATRYRFTWYYVYHIFTKRGGWTWKYGITRAVPHTKRPASQLGACSRYFGRACTYNGYWVLGWFDARSLEAFFILQYVARHGYRHCPPGQWSSCR
jgi:RHS repeat-associated protein